MERSKLKRQDLIYPELCYQIIGALFHVGTSVGAGHKEHFYQKAAAEEFKNRGLYFKEQLPAKISYRKKQIGLYYFDFLIEKKVILEIKVRNYFSKQDINQLYAYLKAMGLQLGIIAHFTKSGVKFKRVVNLT